MTSHAAIPAQEDANLYDHNNQPTIVRPRSAVMLQNSVTRRYEVHLFPRYCSVKNIDLTELLENQSKLSSSPRHQRYRLSRGRYFLWFWSLFFNIFSSRSGRKFGKATTANHCRWPGTFLAFVSGQTVRILKSDLATTGMEVSNCIEEQSRHVSPTPCQSPHAIPGSSEGNYSARP